MTACKPRFTAAERAILEPLAVRCIVAAVRQSKAEATYERASHSMTQAECDRRKWSLDQAEAETCAAGKAFDRALRKARGGK